jgi:hypothetical protein
MTIGLFAQIGLIAHLFSLLVPTLGATNAGLAATLATSCAVAGRTLVGWVLPPGADRRRVAAANLAVQIAGCLAFLLSGGTEVPLLLLGTMLVGLGIGNQVSLPSLIAQREFAIAEVERVVALITATSQAGYAFAPAFFALLRPADGAAPFFFTMAAALLLVAALIFLSARETRLPTRILRVEER